MSPRDVVIPEPRRGMLDLRATAGGGVARPDPVDGDERRPVVAGAFRALYHAQVPLYAELGLDPSVHVVGGEAAPRGFSRVTAAVGYEGPRGGVGGRATAAAWSGLSSALDEQVSRALTGWGALEVWLGAFDGLRLDASFGVGATKDMGAMWVVETGVQVPIPLGAERRVLVGYGFLYSYADPLRMEHSLELWLSLAPSARWLVGVAYDRVVEAAHLADGGDIVRIGIEHRFALVSRR